MKSLNLKPIAFALILGGFWQTQAQESKYDYYDAFAPNFYTKNATETRSASGKPGHAYWQNEANYVLTANLNESKNEISGTSEINYTNNSPDDLEFVWVYLDQNIFEKNSRGNAIIPTNGSRNGARGQNFDGGTKINNVQTDGKNTVYEIIDTRMKITLAKPLKAKGGKLKININFSFISPEYGSDRMGYVDTKNGRMYSVAQWYPRMCVYDDIYGWNTLPYLGPSEFYLEYGKFDISITAPANHFVLCSGELMNASQVLSSKEYNLWKQAKESDKTLLIRTAEDLKNQPTTGTKTWKYSISNSRDVAWSSSKAFIVDGAKMNLPSGKKAFAVSAYPEESASQKAWGRATEYTKASIEMYSKKWVEFPYPMAVNVAGNQGGMEYPGIVFCDWKSDGQGLWGVTDHEFGHNWFPMMVGSNEKLHAWMDEGFNTFINTINTAEFNKGEYKEEKQNLHLMADVLTSPNLEPVYATPETMKERSIGLLAYMKPGAALTILRENILGKERFDTAFKTYIERWKYKHPTPDDFFRTMENVAGENLNWFWRSFFINNWRFDQGINSVKYVKNDAKNGALITIDNLEKMPLPVIMDVYTSKGATRVNLPVEIWQRNKSWVYQHPSNEAITKIVLDPDKDFPDSNSKNNIWAGGDTVVSVKYKDFYGDYSSEKVPLKINISEDNGKLVLSAEGQNALEMRDLGNQTFKNDTAGLEVVFGQDKKTFALKIQGQSFDFKRN